MWLWIEISLVITASWLDRARMIQLNTEIFGVSGLTVEEFSDTLCHMKTITIRQLHDETGRWVRKAAALGELQVTERGRVIAKLVPATTPPELPYFAQRKLLPAYQAANLRGGVDSTVGIGEDRER